MDTRQYLILFVTLVVAAVFLYIWKRRDAGRDPANKRWRPKERPTRGAVNGFRVSAQT